jgi:hypothetical protein
MVRCGVVVARQSAQKIVGGGPSRFGRSVRTIGHEQRDMQSYSTGSGRARGQRQDLDPMWSASRRGVVYDRMRQRRPRAADHGELSKRGYAGLAQPVCSLE